MRRPLLLTILLVLAGLTACGESGERHIFYPPIEGQSVSEPAPPAPVLPTKESLPPNSAMLDAPDWLRANAPIEWTAPPGWTQELSTRPGRLVEFTVEKNGPGGVPLQCVIFKGVDNKPTDNQTNIDRWTAFFEQDKAPQKSSTEHDGLKLVRWRVHGRFQGQVALGTGEPLNEPNWTMLCGWIESPGGSLLWRFTGPDAIISANESKVDALLASMKSRKQQ